MSRPALEVADIFRDHGPAWRQANAGHVSLGQLKVMSAIERCRTAALGGHVMRCENEKCGWCRPKCGWNYNWHNLRETNYSILCGEFKWLIDGLCGKTLPAIDFAHVDLTGSKQRPEQHGSRVRRRQHGLRLDPALELLV